jgi:hypothetical protein
VDPDTLDRAVDAAIAGESVETDPGLAAFLRRLAGALQLPPLTPARRAALRARVLGPDPAPAEVSVADANEVPDEAVAVP